MSERLSSVAPTLSAAVPATRTERRQMRRAGISLQIRIRSADFNDGNFDEIRLTQNASRKAIYFFTELNRYYKGMRVRVTSPHDPSAGAVNLEQIGEVVRVHRREDGYGVAVALLACAQLASTQPDGPRPVASSTSMQGTPIATTAPSERRCATRLPFIAPVEMVEMCTGSRIQARTSDLSAQGCYVDTLNPLPVGAAVRLQIHRAGLILDALAKAGVRGAHGVAEGRPGDLAERTGLAAAHYRRESVPAIKQGVGTRARPHGAACWDAGAQRRAEPV